MPKENKQQETKTNTSQNGKMSLMFYNVENLVDTFDDPNIDDEDFTPGGKLNWDQEKYTTKLVHTAQVIESISPPDLPAIVGFAEVENKRVIEDLINKTKLKGGNYNIVHRDSPDKRGIDVALIYNNQLLKEVQAESINIQDENLGRYFTRDILYVQLLLQNNETLHVFVNHWPSRRDGKETTESKRVYAAKTLRKRINQILEKDVDAKIITMGDFNDTPDEISIEKNLQAKKEITIKSDLFNPYIKINENGLGSVFFEGEYASFDQIMISKSVYEKNSGLMYEPNSAATFRAPFVTFRDPKTGVQRPNRTYSGDKYHGGYSDHLAVYLKLRY